MLKASPETRACAEVPSVAPGTLRASCGRFLEHPQGAYRSLEFCTPIFHQPCTMTVCARVRRGGEGLRSPYSEAGTSVLELRKSAAVFGLRR